MDEQLQPIDSGIFINEVRKRPEIWDINCEEYKDMESRQQAWAKVAKAFLVNYDLMSISEKANIQKKLYDKWRNIRDAYVKSKRTNQKKLYMYSVALHFLDDIYQINDDPDNEDVKNIRLLRKRKQKKRSLDDSNDAWPSDESNLETKKKKKIEKIDGEKVDGCADVEFVDNLPEIQLPCNTFIAEDEDRSFFNSLLPAVRQFSMDQKLEFRSEIINIVKKIRANTT